MSKIQPRTLSGFMELLPARQAQFDRMVDTLKQTKVFVEKYRTLCTGTAKA